MQKDLNDIKAEILAELDKISDLDALRELEVKFLGRKSQFTNLLKSIAGLDADEKRLIGQLANDIKLEIKDKFSQIKAVLDGRTESADIDAGVPGLRLERGHLSPLSHIQYELEDIFTSMGFMILDGPELESDFYNFEGLNIPGHHPARDMQDTFYVGEPHPSPLLAKERGKNEINMVMRTHTSPMQVRAMRKYGAPLRCVVPGRVFRAEATDAVHEHTFDQMEGLVVGEGISLCHLIGTMQALLNGVFRQEIETRIRPGYFPFVEPGIELDIKCTICHGAKCPACKHTGWLEILPAGMVHPSVLQHGGLDPDKYSGFAFGLGLTRLAMMRYGIGDIRLFNSGDLRFVRQF